MSKYPEHDKLQPKAEFLAIKNFCESLDERNIQLTKWDKKDNTDVVVTAKDLLFEYFGTTDKKLEKERTQMLKEMTQKQS